MPPRPEPRRRPLALALVALVAAPGCFFLEDPCECPPQRTFRPQSGRWASQADAAVDVYPFGQPSQFPHGAEPKTLAIDLDAGVVTITRTTPSGVFVERWRARPPTGP